MTEVTKKNVSSDPIWIDDFSILYRKDKLVEFFPKKKESKKERINSLMRLSFYISLILCIYYSNLKYSAIFVFFMIFSLIIYKNHPDKMNSTDTSVTPLTLQEKYVNDANNKVNNNSNNTTLNDFTPTLGTKYEKFQGEPTNLERVNTQFDGKCTAPSIDNPFMNFTMNDYMTFDKNGSIVDRPGACNTNDINIKKQIEEKFNNNLFRDTNDLFGKMNSQRNYYTMPSTNIVNAQEDFAKWLYLNPSTCKENQDSCLNYEDIRGKPFIFPNQNQNPINSEAKKNIV